MSNLDLEDVIQGAIEDSVTPEDDSPEIDTAPATDELEVPEVADEPTTTDTPAEPTDSIEVPSPAAQTQEPKEEDSFAKKFGIPSQSSSGRENRIPYSRVKKIVSRAEKDLEATFTPKITEYETKVKDYEGRLQKVAQFEQVLANEPTKFLEMLATMPAYRQIFEAMVAQAAQPSTPAVPPAPVAEVSDDMPQPDTKLADGSSVYSMEGLKALNAWNRAQARKETLTEVEKRFGPIEQEWQTNRQIQALVPQVQAQIDEARTWHQFNENEPEIVKALQSNSRLSLEGAYRQVVLPKLAAAQADYDKKVKEVEASTRKKVLAELKKAPTSTSVSTSATRGATESGGKQSLEDIIKAQVDKIR